MAIEFATDLVERLVRAGADVGARVSVAVQQDPARDLET